MRYVYILISSIYTLLFHETFPSKFMQHMTHFERELKLWIFQFIFKTFTILYKCRACGSFKMSMLGCLMRLGVSHMLFFLLVMYIPMINTAENGYVNIRTLIFFFVVAAVHIKSTLFKTKLLHFFM